MAKVTAAQVNKCLIRGSISTLTQLRTNLDEVAQNLRGIGRGDDVGVLRKIDSELSDVVDWLALARDNEILEEDSVASIKDELVDLAPVLMGDEALEELQNQSEDLAKRFEGLRDRVKAKESFLIMECLTEKA